MATRAEMNVFRMQEDIKTLEQSARICARRGQPSLARLLNSMAVDITVELREHYGLGAGAEVDHGE